MTSEFKDRHLELAIRKYKDLNALSRWVYLLENAHENSGQLAAKHGVSLSSVKRAKRVVTQLSEDLEAWCDSAKAAYIRVAKEEEAKSNIVDAEFEDITNKGEENEQ